MGFCVFNNAAIAASFALRDHKLERVAFVDWDVHHGNGTQSIFWNDDRVLTMSMHQDIVFRPIVVHFLKLVEKKLWEVA